jgi:hypothetical protein
MRFLILIAIMTSFAYSDTLTKRIYQQAVASPAGVQSRQIGVNTTADADLGFKMWFGKDADGNLTQFTAKDKNARFLSVRQDSTFSKFDTSKHYRSPLANFDSTKSTALNAPRLYTDGLKIGTGNTLQSISISADTLYIKRSDTIFFIKMAH